MKNIISLLLFIIPLSVFCQPKAKPEIRNINCVNDGKYAILFYDLENTAKNDKYFVEIKITHANGTVIKTRTLSGDAGVVYGGLQRKAFWNYKADSVGLKDDIFVNVKATPVPEIPLAPHLLKSLIYPGWGSQKLSNNKKSLALGGLSYACLASGIILNIASAANYEAYKSSTDFSKVDALYKRSLLQKNLFFALTGVASAIWVYDLFNVFHKRALLLKRKVPVDNNYYYKNVEKQSLSAVSKPLFLNTFDVVKPPKPELIEASVKFEMPEL